jgi:hypothetical protein
LHRCFLKLRLNGENSKLLRRLLAALHRHCASRSLLRACAYRLYLFHLKHYVRSSFLSLRRNARSRARARSLGQHQAHVSLLRSKSRLLLSWRAAAEAARKKRVVGGVVGAWARNTLRYRFSAWRLFSLKVEAWQVLLSFHKWRSESRRFLRLRGRLLARRRARWKRGCFRRLREACAARREVKAGVLRCLRAGADRFVREAFSTLALNSRYRAVQELRANRAKAVLLKNMKLRLTVAEIQRFYCRARFYKVWKGRAKISIVSRWLLLFRQTWTTQVIVARWREWAGVRARAGKMGAAVRSRRQRGFVAAAVGAWRRVTWASLVAEQSAKRKLKTRMSYAFTLWEGAVAAIKTDREACEEGDGAWTRAKTQTAFDALWRRAAAATIQRSADKKAAE